MTKRPPLSQLIIYALGQLGWSLASFGAANLLVYFYLPPESDGAAVFPAFIYQGAILGVATLIGFINFGGRIFDAVTDPWIAAWSDNRPITGGKRKKVLRLAAIPFAGLSFLLFFPPVAGLSVYNVYWLIAIVFLFYLFFTLYLVPYNALIPELGHHPPDRMRISTLISIAWALGFVIGGMAYGIQGYFENFTDSVQAFQWTIGAFAGLSLLLMLIPAFFLQEETYAQQQNGSTVPPKEALGSVFQNKNFRIFIGADLLYWLALTFIQQGVSYYVTALFGWPKEQASAFLAISFVASFLLYWPVNIGVKRFGKRNMLLSAFLVFCAVFAITALVPQIPLGKTILFYGVALLAAYPLATFGIVPNALIADFVHDHQVSTGQQQAGMFYAVRNFMMKIGISLAVLLFPSFLLLGKSASEPTGVIASAGAACVFCLLGYLIMRRVKLSQD
ncbi:MFS transporter [Lewinella cohaerens]|uniref:MFS transporter n=1 Tax=Lewinella cohaerens TaxID=70995 RepID=UPI00037144A8|nr:MFS transporter [Lewinella cohaerens]